MVAELEKPLNTLKKNYGNRLNKIAADLQKKGDLPGVLAVKAEIKNLKTPDISSPPPEKEPNELISARAIYKRENARLMSIASRQAEPLTKNYKTRLLKFKEEFTRQGNLEHALAAKRLLESVPEINSTKPTASGKRELKMRIQVDGVSHLFIKGSKIWFDHTNGTVAPPGRHSGEFPTYLDEKTEWMPVWNGKVTEPFDAGIALPTSGERIKINLRNSDGRGHAEVIEQPSNPHFSYGKR